MDKETIEKGRQAVYEYRSVHAFFIKDSDNTFFVNSLFDKLINLGYLSIEHFFQCNREYNLKELGFDDEDDFDIVVYDSKTDEIVDEKLLTALKDMWW